MRRIICFNICYSQGKNNFLSGSQFSMISIYFYVKFLFVEIAHNGLMQEIVWRG